MKSIATVTLGGTLPEKLHAIAEAGFKGVELMEKDLLNFKGSTREIKDLSIELGLEIITFHTLRDFEGCPRQLLQQGLSRAERMFDTMGELGILTLLVCSNVSEDASTDYEVMASDLTLLIDRAKRRGLRIGYEALSWGSRIRTYKDAWHLVKLVADPCLGLVLDTFHTFCLGDDLTELSYIPLEHIFCIQVADAPRIPVDPLRWSRNFRCFPSFGDFDLPMFLAPLLAKGYVGPLSLEIFNAIYPSMPPISIAAQGFSTLCNLEAAAKVLSLSASPYLMKIPLDSPKEPIFQTPLVEGKR